MATGLIEDLRRQLREKFPQAHAAAPALQEKPAPDQPLDAAAFPTGAISEVIGSGVGMLIAGLLGDPETAAPLPEFVLVDGGDGFDPASFTRPICSRLLWVRCRTAAELLKAADLLVRDGNVPFIFLDTCGIPLRELRGVPSSAWWRLKLATEATCCRLVVMSLVPQVPCATVRLTLNAGLRLEDFARPRQELVNR